MRAGRRKVVARSRGDGCGGECGVAEGCSVDRIDRGGIKMEMLGAVVWLLRSCGQHERAIDVLQERMDNSSVQNK